jgi:predicted transposase YdaD
MRHQFQVVRLWEQPTQPFLESTGLLPLAVLTQTPDQAQTLRQVAAKIEAIPEKRVQNNIAAASGILAGLKLERGFINQVLRKDIMQQSVIYQEWIEEGALKEAQSLVLRQLTLRIGDMAPELRSQVQALSLPQFEALSEALLDFSKPEDLVNWLLQRN